MWHHILLILHLVAAAIWVGGHLILVIRIFPQAMKQKAPGIVAAFEERFEVIGIPALLIQIITGIIMSYNYGITFTQWFSFSSPAEKVVSVKLILLLLTLVLAVHARLFIIPKLNAERLPALGLHIFLVTLIGVAMLVLGTFIRFGGL